jgi:hypothetical protein
MNIPARTKIARYLLSFLPKTGLVTAPSRPHGISAMMRVCNENSWLEASVRSIKDHVDEIIAVDTGSTDGSLQTLERLAVETKKLKVFSFHEKRAWEFSNFALKRTSFRWIMKWDADFVASSGPGAALGGLKDYLFGLDQSLYYYINPRLIELTGDFYHQFPDMRVRGDMEVFTYSEEARYVPVERRFTEPPYPVKLPKQLLPEVFNVSMEGMRLPYYYRVLSCGMVAAYHVNVKPALRHLLGYFYLQWLGNTQALASQTLEEYSLQQVKGRWRMPDLESAAAFYMDEYAKRLSKYDERLGAVPQNIQALAVSSPYEIIYSAGKPAGRTERRQP